MLVALHLFRIQRNNLDHLSVTTTEVAIIPRPAQVVTRRHAAILLLIAFYSSPRPSLRVRRLEAA
jgi:hypothetical protein